MSRWIETRLTSPFVHDMVHSTALRYTDEDLLSYWQREVLSGFMGGIWITPGRDAFLLWSKYDGAMWLIWKKPNEGGS